MKVLVLNSGSSSLKCQVYEVRSETDAHSIAKVTIERVGTDQAALSYVGRDGVALDEERPCRTHLDGVRRVLELLADPEHGVVAELTEIDAVGHRVVHAGEAFSGSVPASAEVMAALDACCDLAPLHNPANLAGIRACAEALPGTPQVCVFDNALHHSLPPEAYLYGLPRSFYTEHRVRRYGFHGVALRSIVEQVEQHVGRPSSQLRIVSLMLGSGCTANALDHGRSVAVSTGFTPLEGLVQSTRCGDLDPAAVLYLLRAGHSPGDLSNLFNRQSGLKGVSGFSNDMRDLKASAEPRAKLAIDLFLHRAVRYLGAYVADMGGLDVLAFGGGIGQHNADLRARLCAHLSHLGLKLDHDANERAIRGRDGLVSAPESKVAVVVASVDEELVIARDTRQVVLAP